MLFVVIGTLFYSRSTSNNFEGQNLVSKLWINIEMIAFIVEVPYWYFLVEVQAKKIFDLEQLNEKDTNKKDVYTAIQSEGGTVLNKSRMEELEAEFAEEKMKLEYEEDFVAMTVLCFLKSNTDKFLIHPSK